MGCRERQHSKVAQRAADFLRTTLEPGEPIAGVTFGLARRRSWLGLEALLGALAWFATTYY